MYLSPTIIVALLSTPATANVIRVALERSLVSVDSLKGHVEYVKM